MAFDFRTLRFGRSRGVIFARARASKSLRSKSSSRSPRSVSEAADIAFFPHLFLKWLLDSTDPWRPPSQHQPPSSSAPQAYIKNDRRAKECIISHESTSPEKISLSQFSIHIDPSCGFALQTLQATLNFGFCFHFPCPAAAGPPVVAR